MRTGLRGPQLAGPRAAAVTRKSHSGNNSGSPGVVPPMGARALFARPRPLVAAASMGAAAVLLGVLASAEPSSSGWCTFMVLLSATSIAAGASLRRSVVAQACSRAVGWLVFLPAALVVAVDLLLLGQRPGAVFVALSATTAAALVLGRSNLHEPWAKADFSPVAYRRLFLAGAVAAVTEALAAGLLAIDEFAWGWTQTGVLFAALSTAFLASGLGVLRMRAWGVLLGAASAAAMVGAAVVAHDGAISSILALGALPGLPLVAPVIASRLRPIAASPSGQAQTLRSLAPAAAAQPRIARAESGGASEDQPAVRLRVEPGLPGEVEEGTALEARAAPGTPH